MRALGLVVLCSLSGCVFIDDFSRFHTDAGRDAGPAVDGAFDLAGDGPAADLGHPLTEAEFVALFAVNACAHALYCEGKLGVGALTEMYCHQELTQALVANGGTAGMPVTDVAFDPVAAQQCLDDLAAMLAAGMDCSVSNSPLPASCARVAHGARAVGEHCLANAQCQSGRCDTVDSCGGSCMALGDVGASCTRDEQCLPALRCRGGACGPPGGIHDACTYSDQCGPSLWCAAATGVCEPLPDSGGTCEVGLGGDPCRGMLVCTGAPGASTCLDGAGPGTACDSAHPCQPGLRCSPTAHVCKTLSQPGGTCLSGENCPFFFVCGAGRCTPEPLLGESCDPLRPCVQGACPAMPPGATTCALLTDGAPCSSADDPCTGYCDVAMSRCVPDSAAGATCTSDRQCGAGAACLMGASALQCTSCPP